jgi:hypothetical protein
MRPLDSRGWSSFCAASTISIRSSGASRFSRAAGWRRRSPAARQAGQDAEPDQRAGFRRLGHGLGGGEGGLDPAGVVDEAGPDLGQLDPAVGAVEQGGPDDTLELGDPDRQCRLADAAGRRRPREPALIDHGQKIAEQVTVDHRPHL